MAHIARQIRTDVLLITDEEVSNPDQAVLAYWFDDLTYTWSSVGISIRGSFFLTFEQRFDSLSEQEQSAVLEWKLSR